MLLALLFSSIISNCYCQDKKLADSIDLEIALLLKAGGIAYKDSIEKDASLKIAYRNRSKQIVWAELIYIAYSVNIKCYYNDNKTLLKVDVTEPHEKEHRIERSHYISVITKSSIKKVSHCF